MAEWDCGVMVRERPKQATVEWHTYEVSSLISEHALVIGDGYRAKNTELSRVGLPFARAGNIRNGFHFSGADCFPADELHKVGEKISSPGDTVFTSKGTVGRFAFVKDNTPRFVYSPQLSYWRPVNTNLIEPRFLHYWMASREFSSQFKSVAGQTDMAEYVSLSDQRRMHITLPPVAEQRAIVHVLGTLDDKIELNRRMNETLEEMARALFKSWFVDFDPVRAKMEGRWRRGESLPGLPADLFDLFPDRLVPSEVGELPDGWEVGTVKQLAERIHNGGTPKRSEPTYWNPGEVPWLTSAEVRQSFVLETENFISQVGLARSSAKVIPARSILVALYGATAGQVSMNFRPLSTNQAVSAIIPTDGNRCFCLVALKSQVAELANRAVGSAQQNISKKAVESTTLVLPSIKLRSKYNDLVEWMFDRILQNLEESRTLIAHRDSLLAKLVSGEVRLMETSKTEQGYELTRLGKLLLNEVGLGNEKSTP